MKVRDVMKKEVYTVHPESTLKEVVMMLLKYQVSGLIVIDDNKKVTGVVSEKDIYRILYPSYSDFYDSPAIYTDFKKQEEEIKNKSNIVVSEFMTKDVISTGPDEYIMKVGAIMLAHNIHRLPVINKQGKLVGVITRGLIYHNLFKKKLDL
ncbi:MAG: hypothetical protein A2731_01990 [Candidatus Buchananbacteria bacterium RIFCSPHIGHO2_01_FULL_39_8]|uniref:CBS domain-containing protein n=1 Tax=Candidatus Buchananbacteria bacterium RIFCSPHIGHO2_01_FULL_39_8 TaxID=1797533 RepID=A0A1G1Y260_9BACT|nr:hypothetical protein [uncultured bacterium]OGY45870.1 MAG: hypothetical protein A2731_01990 [Candidatus Buchananbacteria bacterium RIFCSPHIGHO2_01_FULL_39_8]